MADKRANFQSKRANVPRELTQRVGSKSKWSGVTALAQDLRAFFPYAIVSLYIQHTCQPIQFTSIKYSFSFIYLFIFVFFGGIWPYWKMDTGKHNFHEILLLF